MKFDLNKFKKVSSDKSTTTLQHPGGHEIKIAHKVLHPKMREQLAALPMAKGGQVQHFDDGGEAQPQMPAININVGGQPQQPQMSTEKPFMVAQNEATPHQQGSSGNWDEPSKPAQAIRPAVATVPGNPQALPASLAQYAQQNPQSVGDIYSMAALDQQRQGAKNEASALGKQGNEEANIYGLAAGKQQEALDQQNQLNQEWQNEVDDSWKDLKDQHINPNHYMESMGTGQKVSTAIGLLLGGMGGGLMHQENPAMKYLNEQINRDISSQEQNFGIKKTLFSANMERFRNRTQALAMTQAMQTNIYKNQLLETAARSQSPIAQARAQMAAAGFDNQIGQLLQGMTNRQMKIKNMQAMFGQGQSPPGQAPSASGMQNVNAVTPASATEKPAQAPQASVGSPELLEPEMRERLINLPGGGYGLAKRKSDAEGTQQALTSISVIQKQINDMRDFIHNKAGMLGTFGGAGPIPESTLNAQARSMKEGLVLELNKLHNLKRLGDKEYETYIDQVNDPGTFHSSKAVGMLDTLQKDISNKLQSELQNNVEYGFGYKSSQIPEGPPKIGR